ncbi:MAG: dTMP kinase [Micavibrio aeruginosavorus]|uniref:Thymidylate kinase n=1 Tax=Micavibrio aeruginosavorus TaxID=349221 RepID=A0A2W5MPR0_9BACT|nr:MAG: dTMP kinase [Micavibrio aeruginosavorus]
MKSRGLFITFEGGEGAGKTTQIKRLAQSLGDVVLTREPGGTPEAEAIRNTFFQNNGQNWPPEALVLLMFAARVLHTENLIRPMLETGKHVLCDRYTDSTRVYQGYAGNLSLDKIEAVKTLSIGDFEPDLTFIMDIAPEEGLKRTGKRNDAEIAFESKDIAFHENLRQGFLTIARDNPDRCVIINASQEADVIAAQVLAKVKEKL